MKEQRVLFIYLLHCHKSCLLQNIYNTGWGAKSINVLDGLKSSTFVCISFHYTFFLLLSFQSPEEFWRIWSKKNEKIYQKYTELSLTRVAQLGGCHPAKRKVTGGPPPGPARAWAAGALPGWGPARQRPMFLSRTEVPHPLSLPLFPSVSKNE